VSFVMHGTHRVHTYLPRQAQQDLARRPAPPRRAALEHGLGLVTLVSDDEAARGEIDPEADLWDSFCSGGYVSDKPRVSLAYTKLWANHMCICIYVCTCERPM
jgi:hypothetical protein